MLEITPTAKPEQTTEIQEFCKQLNAINDMRDMLLHFGSFVTDDKGRISSNISRQLASRKPKEVQISIETIKNMTHDLEKIQQHIISLRMFPYYTSIDVRSTDYPVLNDAWQYKRPEGSKK